jgi:hypothetical protein
LLGADDNRLLQALLQRFPLGLQPGHFRLEHVEGWFVLRGTLDQPLGVIVDRLSTATGLVSPLRHRAIALTKSRCRRIQQGIDTLSMGTFLG